MPIAADLVKLIFKFERAPYVSNSLRRFGREIVGLDSEKSRSSAYAEILHWVSPMGSP